MYLSSEPIPTRASGGRSVAAMAAAALVVSLVSLQLAATPRPTTSASPSKAGPATPQLPVDSDRLGIVWRGR